MNKEKLYKKFQKAIDNNKYIHTTSDEMSDELEFAFEWFWKEYNKVAEKAYMYDDLCK